LRIDDYLSVPSRLREIGFKQRWASLVARDLQVSFEPLMRQASR
jgi:hypothetical protein